MKSMPPPKGMPPKTMPPKGMQKEHKAMHGAAGGKKGK
jgi:hypothetical protein